MLQEYVETSFKRALKPVAPYLLKLVAGVAAYTLGVYCLAISTVFLATAFFFQLTDTLKVYAVPALTVSIAVFVIAHLWFLVAKLKLRSPR